jgi:serine/threonine-protein kinase
VSLTVERWRRVREVFDTVADLAPAERDEALLRLAGDDAALREEVMELLRALTHGGDRLEPASPASMVGERTEPAGLRLGSYRLLRQVGEGGMGTVFEAVRDDAQFEKRVAIKLVRRGVAGDALIRRFRQERQILAALDHPNIARLLDGGMTADGRPWLVMEFVDGEPITAYSAAHELSVPDRLRLFRAVCDAVQYAHRHLVVHRDLKPGNILVTPDGTPKLLDFGVAKLLPDGATGGLPQQVTATEWRPFTPAYASPEQIRGDAVSTATDVYSLGVILYELLAGRHPFETEGRSALALAQRMETEPIRPSEAVSGSDGGSEPARLRRALAGELDNIILMAMRREPARRYASVEQLAEDVRRLLDGRPVLAQRDTFSYRARKFVRRHRVGVAATAVIVLSLTAGLTATAWQARRAGRERDRAQLEARKAERLNAFLAGVLRAPDPRADGRDVRVMDLLAGAATRSATELAGEPEVLAAVQTAIGLSYAGLGAYDDAEILLASALALRRDQPIPEPSRLAESLGNLASLRAEQGRLAEAEPPLREALATIRPASKADSILLAGLRGQLASLLQARGAWDEAAAEHTGVLALRRRLLGPEHADVAESLNDLAVVRGQQGDWASAEALHREALEVQRRAKGPEHPDIAAALDNLAFVLTEQRRFESADSFYRAALALRTRLLGPEHPETAWTLYGHATMLVARGDPAAAERTARQILALRGRKLADEHPMIAASLLVLGQALAAQGRAADAEPLLRESLALRRANLPAGHWLLASGESVLGDCLTGLRRFDEAETLLLRGYEGLRAAMGAANSRTREATDRLVRHYQVRGDTARAGRWRRTPD